MSIQPPELCNTIRSQFEAITLNNTIRTNSLNLDSNLNLKNEPSSINSDNSICLNLDIIELNTSLLAENIKKFLFENKIRESYFSQKVLRSSFLTFKNIVDSPKEWSLLSDTFKLYFKRAHLFLK